MFKLKSNFMPIFQHVSFWYSIVYSIPTWHPPPKNIGTYFLLAKKSEI